MRAIAALSVACVLWVGLGDAAQAGWSDDFEHYPAGSTLIGQGNWRGWDGDPNFDAVVVADQAFSGEQALFVAPATDVVQMFEGLTAGVWALGVATYIPLGAQGSPYIILLTQYAEGGDKHWTVQVQFDNARGAVRDDFTGAELPLIVGVWVDLLVVIDLDNDWKKLYYDGQLLSEATWTCAGCANQPAGPLNVSALDLYGNQSSGMYVDRIFLAGQVSPLGTGDSNCDGVLNFGDINPFVLALADPAAYALQFPNCSYLHSNDMNGDGRVDFDDVDGLVFGLFGNDKSCVFEITAVTLVGDCDCLSVGTEIEFAASYGCESNADCPAAGTKEWSVGVCLTGACYYDLKSVHRCR